MGKMTAGEFWVEDYSQRDRQIISGYDDKMNFAEAYVEDQIKELKGYVRHHEGCEIVVLSHPEDCTCGLTELLNKH